MFLVFSDIGFSIFRKLPKIPTQILKICGQIQTFHNALLLIVCFLIDVMDVNDELLEMSGVLHGLKSELVHQRIAMKSLTNDVSTVVKLCSALTVDKENVKNTTINPNDVITLSLVNSHLDHTFIHASEECLGGRRSYNTGNFKLLTDIR